MSIIERTTKLLLTQFKGSSIKPAFLNYYTADMKKLDDYAIGADNRLSALEAEDILLDGRLDTLEGWADNTVNPTLTSYGNRLNAIEAVIENVSDQNIRDLMERLSALENKVDANTTAIDGLAGRVDALEDELVNIRNGLNNVGADLVALGRRITRLEECCEEVRVQIAGIDDILDNHGELLSGLRTDVNRNAENIQANAEDITILSGQISTINTNVNALLNDMDVQHIVEFASVNTDSITAKGLTFTFTSEGGWCHVDIAGNLTEDIDEDTVWDEVVPDGFIPAVVAISNGLPPVNIINGLIAFKLKPNGDIESVVSTEEVASGTTISHVMNYPLAQP